MLIFYCWSKFIKTETHSHEKGGKCFHVRLIFHGDISQELKIKGGNEDNSETIFLFLDKNICCDPSL